MFRTFGVGAGDGSSKDGSCKSLAEGADRSKSTDSETGFVGLGILCEKNKVRLDIWRRTLKKECKLDADFSP